MCLPNSLQAFDQKFFEVFKFPIIESCLLERKIGKNTNGHRLYISNTEISKYWQSNNYLKSPLRTVIKNTQNLVFLATVKYGWENDTSSDQPETRAAPSPWGKLWTPKEGCEVTGNIYSASILCYERILLKNKHKKNKIQIIHLICI